MDSTITAGDSISVDLSNAFRGDVLLIDIDFVTEADAPVSGKPGGYSLVTEEKGKNSTFKDPKFITGASKFTLKQIINEFKKLK